MNWQKTVGIGGVALVVTGMFPAHAQKDGIERALAGIRINASAKEILRVFGNPNDIQIGDVAVRPPSQAGGGQGGTQGMPGMGGADDGGAMPGMGGRGMGSSGMSGMGSSGMMGGGKMGAMGGGMSGSMSGSGPMGGGGMSMGGPSGMGGGMSGMSGSMGSSGMQGKMGGGGPMGMGGPSGMGGGMQMGGRGMGSGSRMGAGTDDGAPVGGGGMQMGGGGGGLGAFGQTVSSSTFQQEVTWSYSMKALDAKKQKQAIGYDFLISPEGKVSQIRITGYVPRTAKDKSAKGLTLGSTYKDLIRTYGNPKSVMKSGELLVCSYPTQHIEFQLMNMKYVNGYTDPYNGIYKVVAIQINGVE